MDVVRSRGSINWLGVSQANVWASAPSGSTSQSDHCSWVGFTVVLVIGRPCGSGLPEQNGPWHGASGDVGLLGHWPHGVAGDGLAGMVVAGEVRRGAFGL